LAAHKRTQSIYTGTKQGQGRTSARKAMHVYMLHFCKKQIPISESEQAANIDKDLIARNKQCIGWYMFSSIFIRTSHTTFQTGL
jgi:hypothetical protein